MSQQRQLVRGGLVLFLAATHVGCAGSGVKNLFTRNETDGYHSIDELEAEERKLAEAEESDYEDASPSIAARITSWRPFSIPEASEEDAYAANESDTSDTDSQDRAKSSKLLGRAFAKRDSVDPDPFLETESVSTKRSVPPTSNAALNREIAELDETPAAVEDEFVITPDPKANSDKKAKAGANKAVAKSESTGTKSEDADALAKRFEQHFLLNSVGTVAKTEAADSVAGGAEALQKKAATIVASADSKQRHVSSLAEKQINAFDYLLGSDSSNSERITASKHKPAAEPLKAVRSRDVVDGTSSNSLAAFDSLIGIESNTTTHPVIEAANKITHQSQYKSAAVDINVAEAESLFGAAAARQNSREKRPATANTAQTSNKETTDNEFHWNETRGEKALVETGFVHAEATGRSVSRRQSRVNEDNELFYSTVFGAPPATAGNIEGDDCSIVETAESQMSVKAAFANHQQDVSSRTGRNRANVAILPATMESSLTGDVDFIATPVAPVPELESTDRVAPASSRPGLIQSLSVRNWMLLIGGIVVIALLFAPGRTKPATMTSRTANG